MQLRDARASRYVCAAHKPAKKRYLFYLLSYYKCFRRKHDHTYMADNENELPKYLCICFASNEMCIIPLSRYTRSGTSDFFDVSVFHICNLFANRKKSVKTI